MTKTATLRITLNLDGSPWALLELVASGMPSLVCTWNLKTSFWCNERSAFFLPSASLSDAGDPGGVSVIVFTSGNSSNWGSMVQSSRLVSVVSDVRIVVNVLTAGYPPGGKGKF